MSKERVPKQVVLYVQLEDNVGAVLAKRKLEVPVQQEVDFEVLVENLIKAVQ